MNGWMIRKAGKRVYRNMPPAIIVVGTELFAQCQSLRGYIQHFVKEINDI